MGDEKKAAGGPTAEMGYENGVKLALEPSLGEEVEVQRWRVA